MVNPDVPDVLQMVNHCTAFNDRYMLIMRHACTHVLVFCLDPKLKSFNYFFIGIGSVS